MDANAVSAAASVATVCIAVATGVIAWRQTQISDEQKRLGVREVTASEKQQELSERLMALELQRDTPKLVPGRLESLADGALAFSLYNVGGGAATDVWIEALTINDRPPRLLPMIGGIRIDLVRDSARVLLEGAGQDLINPEKVVALIGNFSGQTGDSKIAYEAAPGLLDHLRRALEGRRDASN